MSEIRNVHSRTINAPRERVFAELEAMGTERDRVWPAPKMPFRRTPGPLRDGVTTERHGVIRAVLESHEPGRSMSWAAELPFLRGRHGFRVRDENQGCHVEHVLEGKVTWWFRPVWATYMRRVHDRILEALLDRLERAATA